MPIYEFECTKCGKHFEFMAVRTSDKPSCPDCSATELKKLMSASAVRMAPASGGGEFCNKCPGGPCRMRED